MKRLFSIASLQILTLVLAMPLMFKGVQADNLFGEFKRVPNSIERGFSIGADFGVTLFSGDQGTLMDPGFQMSFTTGYDIMPFLSVEGIYQLGINEAQVGAPAFVGPSGGMNLFSFSGVVKGSLPLGRLYPFVFGGAGYTFTNPDFLAGQGSSTHYLFGGGVEYYTLLRHYSVYAKVTHYQMGLPFNSTMVAAGLKYTF